ncbi:MAG: DUF1727 domain-containing protein [Eubacterium sp.]|nr:DUF1727 domain-containing protein [Eubacterium sp.]
MKLFLAVLVCRFLHFVGGILGRGSSLPGLVALKICPDALARVKLPPAVIAVTGSNGKTSTVEMAAHVLNKAGKKVIYNREGSNQIAGAASLILSACTFSGKVKGDVILLETDERYAKHIFKYFTPTHYVITNLLRDQLTRNGHPEWVYREIEKSISRDTTLVLNADDPLVSCFAEKADRVVWFGMDRQPFCTEENTGVYDDGKYCPKCKAPMKYDYYHFNHIGSYHCTKCGHEKAHTDYTVTSADLDRAEITINGEYNIKLSFSSIYNVYNILACFAVCELAGADGNTIAENVNSYVLKNGRIVRYRLGENDGVFLVSKHENSVSYDSSLKYIAQNGGDCAVIIIVDSVSRRYETGETSWLWDVNFEWLASDNIKRIYLSGKHCTDLINRISYTSVSMLDKVEPISDIEEMTRAVAAERYEKLYTVTCFSDKDKFLSKVKVGEDI